MLIVDFYIFKQVLANPRKYFSAAEAQQLEKLPGLNNFCNLLEDLIFNLCREELQPTLVQKFTSKLWMTSTPSQSRSSSQTDSSAESLLQIKNFLNASHAFCKTLHDIFRPLEEKDVAMQPDETGPEILPLKQFTQPLFRFFSALESLSPSAFTNTFLVERSKGCFAYIEKRDQFDALAKNYLKLREMYNMIAVIHSQQPAKEFREILDKLQKIPLPFSLLATCDHKILLERYDELLLQKKNLESPAMVEMFQEINRYPTAFSLKELIRAALGNKQIPISYLPNLLSIAFLVANDAKDSPQRLKHTSLNDLIQTTSTKDFTAVKQTAMDLVKFVNVNRYEEKISVNHLEHLVHGAHLQIRLSFSHTVSHQSTPEEITEYILKKYYLQPYPNVRVNPDELCRRYYGFDHISRVALLLQLLVRFYSLPRVLSLPNLKTLDKDELRLLTLAVTCYAADNINENPNVVKATTFRSEALLLGFTIDQVESIAWALENKDNHSGPRNFHQWLIHDSIRFDELRFVKTLGKEEFVDTFKNINPVELPRFKRLIENYANVVTRFMASNRLQLQQSENPFLACKALMYQIALDFAVFPSSTRILGFNPSYLVLGEIDPLMLFDPSPELLKHALTKLYNEWRNTNSDQSALSDHKKVCFELYSLISTQISDPLAQLADYHHRNLLSPETAYVLATRYLDNHQSAKLTASPEFKKLWDYAVAQMKDDLFTFATSLLRNRKISFSYVSNALSIASQLYGSPFFAEYREAVAKQDLETLTKIGANLLEQVSKKTSQDHPISEELKQLAVGPLQQIRCPTGIIFQGKLLNRSSSVGEIAQYIIHKHYLNERITIHPYKRLPWHGTHLNFLNLLCRTILVFQLMVRLLREYAPEILRDQKETPLSDSQLCLVSIAILCHDATNLTEFVKNEKQKVEIFKSEASLLGFSNAEIEPIAWALENKENKDAPHNIYHWLIHDANGLHNIKFILDHLESIHKKELSYKALKKDEITRFNRIIQNYETLVKSLLSSRQVGENSFLTTKEILSQIALKHALNPLEDVKNIDTRYLVLSDVDPLVLLDSGPELLRYTMGKLYHDMVTEKFKGSEFESCQEIYFNLFTHISYQKSLLLGRIAKYLCDKIYPLDSILQLTDSYLNDDTVMLTAMPEFQKLWLHAANKIEKFFGFISDLLCNATIPFSYLHNAISIALHLLDTPYLAEYMYRASENVASFQKRGARLLEQAHQYIFSRPSPNADLRLLALGAHQQIRYPQRVRYKGRFLNSQSPIEKIASYIVQKYYLQPYAAIPALPHYLLRPLHGFDHISRALLLFQLVVRFLQVYCPNALRNPGGTPLSDTQLRLVALAVLCHNAANTHDYFKDEAAQAEIFRKEALLLGFHNEGIEQIAWALENKDNKTESRSIFQSLIHDPGCFEYMRVTLDNLDRFLSSELDIATVLITSEARAKFDRIINNYKKILPRFMASCRMSLQGSKNSFLACKALLYQIALDLVSNPSNKGGLSCDLNYLLLGDIDPLLLFDPGPELLKYAIRKLYDELSAKMNDPSLEHYEGMFFNVFTLFSCQISAPLGQVANYLCEKPYPLNSILKLTNRYLNVNAADCIATPEFKKLWLHAAGTLQDFVPFISDLLINCNIPFSYLHNTISIALYLSDTPYLAEYMKAANEDLATFTKTGARLLEKAHKHLYPGQSADSELTKLASGAHQQIRYPQRVKFEGKLLNHQSAVEEIAAYILQKYYLQPYSKQPGPLNGLLRPSYGFDHAARALLLFQLVVQLLKKYHPIVLRNPDSTPLSDRQLRLVALAVLCQDAALTNEYFKEEKPQAEIFRSEALLLGFRAEEVEPIAWALENKDNKTAPRTILQSLIHDPDRFELMRTILSTLDPSRKSELDISTILTTPEASANLDRIIIHYKKIITRFMASNRVPLQASKNGFLATKALLYQIALDLAINPANTGGVEFDASYLVLGDVDPLLLFDPGPELLKYAFEKIYAKMTATNRQGPEFESCLKIYFNLFTLFSYKLSEPLGQIAKYNCGLSHPPCAIVLRLANRYLSDNTVNLTATPEFKKLWLHAADNVKDLASFISDVLLNSKIPFSYLPNAISIALHLSDTSYLHQYKMSVNEDLAAFSNKGARLLEQAHTYLFPNQSVDPELKQLALGAHPQIRYPQRVKFEGEFLNHQSPVEKLAPYIIQKYYLKPNSKQPAAPNGLLRPFHGFDHVSRALLIFQLGVRLLQEYAPEALRDQTGTPLSDRQLRLVGLAVLCHDAPNTSEHFENDAAKTEIFRSEALLLGFCAEEIEPIAWAIENKDTKNTSRNIFRWLIHHSDFLVELRDITNINLYRKNELEIYNMLAEPEFISRLNSVIANYHKITTRFMASDRAKLQTSKNSFLATRALLCQIAFDLAANPSNTSGLDFDPDYLILGDVDPLLLFDPSPEFLKYAFNKINRELSADISESDFKSYRKIYFNLFKLISYQISKPLGKLADSLCQTLYNLYSAQKQGVRFLTRLSLFVLTHRFLNDSQVNLTATKEFEKLWDHAESKFNEFITFMVGLLSNRNVPVSYLHNAISIALHLLDTPYLAEYMKAAEANEDLAAFSNKGARLLEQAHTYLFPNQSVDPELKQLALGAHPQIRYPQRVKFEGQFLNHQSPVEEIARYIIKKYYLQPYPKQPVVPNKLLRPFHGFDHASRTLLIFQLGVHLLQEYAPEALRDQTGTPLSDRQLRLVALAVLCHDAANTDEVFNDEAAQAEIFRSEALLLGFNAEEIKPIAWALENKDNKTVPRNIYQKLIHDPDCLEYMRVILNNLNSFRISELDLATLIKPEASEKFLRIISNYKKIITRFMAVDIVVLLAFQISKNSFLATKGLLCQIALDLAVNPSNTSRVDFNASYLVFDDVNPLLLFDFGPELLKYAVSKLYHKIVPPDEKPGFRENRELYFNLFTLISCQISEPLGNLARFLCKELKVVPIHSLANRYLNDNMVKLTATTEFKKLWLHAEAKLEKFFEFVSNLLSQRVIPFSYLSNAISIALHLSDTPYLAEYMRAADHIGDTANQNLAAFTQKGARLLEQAHKHFFPNQSIDPELTQLALGAHQQIRYPERVIFEGKLLTYQTPVEEIAPYIIQKYYLQPYSKQLGAANGLFRPFHGFDHASRALLIFQLGVCLLREHAPEALRDQIGTPLSDRQLRLVALAVLCHDAANTNEVFNDEAAQAEIFRSEALLLGFSAEEIKPIAWALENKDNKTVPRNIYQKLIHDPDCLEYMRVILNNLNSFRISELDLATLIKPEDSEKFLRIISNYKKIITRFMASDRVPLQASKNSFLATKALLYQIALDLAVNPSATGGVKYDSSYIVLCDRLGSLLLFDPGPALLKHTFTILLFAIVRTQFKGPEFESYRKIYFNLFTLTGYSISEPLGQLAKYVCGRPTSVGGFGMISTLADSFLDDKMVTLTATPEFKKLWFHAAGKLTEEQFLRFVSELLYFKKVPFSYLPNVISISLHLSDTPYLSLYLSAALDKDLDVFRQTGARKLEQAHQHLFPNKPVDPLLKELALGVHQQIRYPQRVIFEGKLLTYQSPVEEIAPYIIQKYYLQPYPGQPVVPNVLLRPFQGFDHASRALLLFQLVVGLLQKYHPTALRNPNGTPLSDNQLRLVALAVLCHDAANTDENFKNEAAQAEIFRAEALLLGFTNEEIEPIAVALENKDTKGVARTIFQSLIHDADCFEYMRIILNNLDSFRKSELDVVGIGMFTREAKSKLDNVIEGYKKIIARFMASNRMSLQTSKNSFLATKALLYQVAIDVAAFPSLTTNVLLLDSNYLLLEDIDPLMLFDPGPELLKFAINKVYQTLVTAQKEDTYVPDCEKLYIKLYAIISYQVSEQCGKLAEYHDKGNYAEETTYRIAIRYLEDKTVAGILASPSFKRLWEHSVKIMGTRFFWFITQLFRNEKIPFSYIPNAICIALHLLQSSHLNDYIEAAEKADLSAFKKLGAQFLDKHNFPLPENGGALLRLALGQDQQIKYPLVHFRGKLINSQSSIDDIAPYIIEKYYLEHFPNQAAPLPPLFRNYRGFDHVSRCVVLFNVLLKLLEEESPKELLNPQGKLLSEKEKTLLQLALLCHEAASLTDPDRNRDRWAQAEIFRHEAELLGFPSIEFEPIAAALINKNVKGPSRHISQWLIHDADCLEYVRYSTNNPNAFRKEELDIYNNLIKANNRRGIDKLTNIIEKYKQLVTTFMTSDRLPLQQHSNPFLATQAFLYQLAIHHSIPSAGNKIIFEPNTVGLVNLEPLTLFESGPEFLRKVSEKLELSLKNNESTKELFKTEGLYLRALVPVAAQTQAPVAALTRTQAEEVVTNSNREIIIKSKITNNSQQFWQGYQQNKLTGIKFRPATFIKEDLAILPYNDNRSVSFLIRVKDNNKAVKFYKSNTVSNAIANGNFTFQRTQDGIKALDTVEDLERKLIEINERRLGKQPDPYNRYYGGGPIERNEIFLVNYDFKDITGINIGRVDSNPNYKNNLLEALYWYVRLALANQELPHLYSYCPHIGKLVPLSIKDLLGCYFNNVTIPSVIKHNLTYFGDIQLQNPTYQAITTVDINKAKITMTKILSSSATSKNSEIYTVVLESGKQLTASLHYRGFPVVKIDGEVKSTYDSKGLFRQIVRVYQEQTAQNCQKLLLDAKSYLENKYRIVSIDIKIVHDPKTYLNVQREKNYLYCEVKFLESRFDNIQDVYIDKLQTLLGIKSDKKTELKIDMTQRKLTLRDRTPHKIVDIFEKLQREIIAMRKEKEVTSRNDQNAAFQDDSHLQNRP